MTKAILLVGTQTPTGLTSAVMGLYHALDRKGVKVGFFKPVTQCKGDSTRDCSAEIMERYARGNTELSLSPEFIQQALENHNLDEAMEMVIRNYEQAKAGRDVVIVEGLLENAHTLYASEVNREVARALDADVIVVTTAQVESMNQLESRLDYVVNQFGGQKAKQVLGAIVNRVDGEGQLSSTVVRQSGYFNDNFKLLGLVPDDASLSNARVSDLQKHLKADILFAGEMQTRRIQDFTIFARNATNAAEYLVPNNCIFCPADRDDALMAVTISAASGTNLAALVFTGSSKPSANIEAMCRPLLEKSGLPILHVNSTSWGLMRRMESFNRTIPVDDEERIHRTQEHFAEHIGAGWIDNYLQDVRESVLSPASFRYELVKRAIAANKRIVLPEGDEPRTVVAATQVAARKIAHCVLLADPASVKHVAEQQGVTIGEGITIINPADVREKYVQRLVELRANKGMTEAMAREQLEDNVMLGTMMLEAGEIDGLVSGAVHTTANTMRPPLQIIKTAPNAKMVSSIFFMCLPDKVLVYGDCAIVPKPNAEELAQIAIQSHDTAKAFGIAPKVAMISYSTGTSGTGEDVEKVKEATALVRAQRPDILVDGPLQYDAAAVVSVAASKAPDSPVAGQATVFVFPDLNTGNTTYKAVQRAANAISMGPVLQGMRMPVNDLSRGALIDDIVYTIAITAVQATQN